MIAGAALPLSCCLLRIVYNKRPVSLHRTIVPPVHNVKHYQSALDIIGSRNENIKKGSTFRVC
jgi:hypothetical protein